LWKATSACDVSSSKPGAGEARTERMRVAERRVDHRRQRHGRDQLVDADAGQQPALGDQAIVGRVVELEDRGEVALVVGDAHEHALAARRGARRHQPVGVALVDRRNGRHPHQPARRASSSRRTVCSAGTPPRTM
jgi:hypothetical protein